MTLDLYFGTPSIHRASTDSLFVAGVLVIARLASPASIGTFAGVKMRPTCAHAYSGEKYDTGAE